MAEITSAELGRLADELEATQDAYLRQSGWDEHSAFPGTKWMWSGTLPDGRVVWCDRDTAVCVQQALDAAPGREGEPC